MNSQDRSIPNPNQALQILFRWSHIDYVSNLTKNTSQKLDLLFRTKRSDVCGVASKSTLDLLETCDLTYRSVSLRSYKDVIYCI